MEDLIMLLLKKFIREEDGLEMVEWAIVGALISGLAIFTLRAIGIQINSNLSRVMISLLL